ncbi:MAG TPA: lysophospholipid acyltransferase family protein [Burkholderiales bacterium]|nr:lysophospholipid acyltransferase family protein [Burkholderiales bacterium]
MRRLLRALLQGYDYLVIYLGVIWLGVLCVAWAPFAMILFPLLPERHGRALGRYVAMAGFRLYLGCLSLSRRFSFDLEALDALRDTPSLILAPNHPCLLDALMVISRLPNVACVLKAELMNNVFLGAGARLARFIRNEPARRMMQLGIRDFDCGSQLLLFPEGTRTTSCPVNSFKGSIGVIARHAQVPVQTILIETDSKYLSKGWTLFRKPPMPIHYRVRLGRRFDPPQNTQQFMAELEHYFAHELVRGSAFYPPNTLPEQADAAPQLTSRITS